MKNFFLSAISLILIILLLSGCTNKMAYRDDIACKTITEAVTNTIPVPDGYAEYDEEYLRFMIKETSLHDDFSIYYSTEANDINEIGVFHCPDEQSANTLEETMTLYIEEQKTVQRSFIQSYAPQEIPKLEDAEVRRYGNYVIYLVLDKSKKNDAWTLIEDILKE